MEPKNTVVLVTGGSSGFGHLTSMKLLAKGYTVYAGARRVDRMQDIVQAGGTAVRLDVQDDASVRAMVDRVVADQGHIDVLFNNAGYGNYGFIEAVSLDDIKRQFDVNVFGYARMIKAILPHMRKQRSGRIINTASLISHVSGLGMGWYAASKHAVLAMTEALRMEVEDFGIDVVEIEPGAVLTGFQGVAESNLEAAAGIEDYAELQAQLLAMVKSTEKSAFTPDSTVDAVIHAIETDHPNAVYQTTIDAKIIPKVRGLLGTRLWGEVNRAMVRRAQSEEMGTRTDIRGDR
ncbi:MAG: SDR family NAD(P)-dependent oxidoreductase [Proteobacteria bacterium]|nr:SDR family NAD(P)-dependent oxidoreductase [Pseudomonadota bacterium]